MRNLCCFALLILSTIQLQAQQDLEIESSQPQIILKYTPTSLLNVLYPAIHIGGEFKKDLRGWQLEMGYLLKHHLWDKSPQGFGSWNSENKGFFIKFEYRKYFRKQPDFYFSTQVQAVFNEYRRTDTFDASPQNTGVNSFCSSCVEDTYSINKKAFGLNLKLGYQKELFSSKFVLDTYLGLGLQYMNNQHSHNEDLHRHPAVADSPISYYLPHYPGSYVYGLPTVAVGVKLGYRFNLKTNF